MVTPIKGGFKFNLQSPSQKPGTFNQADYEAMSANLAKAGLNCSDNTPQKMIGYTEQVHDSIKRTANPGPQSGIASIAAGRSRVRLLADQTTDPVPPYHFIIDNDNPFYSKMNVILEKLDEIEEKKLYAVQSHHEKKDFQSTSAGTITDALNTVGQVIGHVLSGNIDPGQLANEMGSFIKEMTSTSQDDFTVSDSAPWFIVVPEKNKNGDYPAIGGVKFDFQMSIHNYKDKKEEQHQSHYEVNQRNIIFTDGEVFEDLYKKVSGE